MAEWLSLVFVTSVLAMTFRMAVPLIFGAVGEAFGERSGVVNLGIEGMMLMGASSGFLVALQSGNVWLGVGAAAFVGALMGLLLAFLTVTIGAQQHVSGLGITILGSGLSFYIWRTSVVSLGGTPPSVEPFEPLHIPVLGDIPVIGPILFQQYALVYIALLVAVVGNFVLFRTNFGLNIRAVGDNPKAADTAGVDVFRIRYICLVIAGTLAAVGGSWLSLAQTGMFLPGLTQGRGWISLALVTFGFWNPYRIVGGALLFGGIDALQLSLQATGLKIPYNLFLMLPYVLTILALVVVARRAIYPAALLKSYRREE